MRLLAPLLLAGCASAIDAAAVRDIRARLEASERTQVETARKLEELDNKVFLLTDQVESQKMALGRRGGEPRLPVISLAPAEERDLPVETSESAEPAPSSADEIGIRLGPAETKDPERGPPPTTIAEGRRPRLSLSGSSTPWLADPPRERAVASTGRSLPRADAADGALPPGVASLGVAKLPGRSVGDPAPIRVRAASDPAALYRAAYDKFMAGRTDEAADEFRDLVKRFPRHDLADNAQYWIGESFYKRQDYKEAAREFRSVVSRWPSGNKVPAALLKLGYSLFALNETGQGRAVLLQVTEHYPNTEEARLAAKRLSELPAAGPTSPSSIIPTSSSGSGGDSGGATPERKK